MKELWYSVFAFFIFCLEPNSKKGNLDENNFRPCYGSFFRKCRSESYLLTAIFKVFSQQIWDTLTTALRDNLQLKILLTGINISANSFLAKHHETAIDKSAWKIISCAKILVIRIKLYQNRRWHFNCYFMLLFVSKKPSF